mmetsp:Transcript_70190/g.195331  ORF Transcript_70190/g.195331 Transcript_70190/m.195331 type:complete len:232 (-) Transcript_70190:2170-2865(-)
MRTLAPRRSILGIRTASLLLRHTLLGTHPLQQLSHCDLARLGESRKRGRSHQVADLRPDLSPQLALVAATASGRVRRTEAEALALERSAASTENLVRQEDVLVHLQVRLVLDAEPPQFNEVQQDDLVKRSLVRLPLQPLANRCPIVPQEAGDGDARQERMTLHSEHRLLEHVSASRRLSFFDAFGALSDNHVSVRVLLVLQGHEPVKHRQAIVGDPNVGESSWQPPVSVHG